MKFFRLHFVLCHGADHPVVASFQSLAHQFWKHRTEDEIREFRKVEENAPADDVEALVRLLRLEIITGCFRAVPYSVTVSSWTDACTNSSLVLLLEK